MEKIQIGLVQKAFGIKGEVKILPMTDFIDERFKKGNEILIDEKGKLVPYTIKSIRPHGGILLVMFDGVNNLNDIEHLNNNKIYIPKEDRHELPDGEYYFDQLLNLDVYVDGEKIGFVEDVLDMPAHPVLRIKKEDTSVLIPYNDIFIKDVSLNNNRIDINWMEGLE